jgi:cyclophilin family peptidyl-prolyl cis-trans isomerase
MGSKKLLPVVFGIIVVVLIVVGLSFWMNQNKPQGQEATPVASASPAEAASPAPGASASPGPLASASPNVMASASPLAQLSPAAPVVPGKVDLSVDANGLSKSTVVVTTNEGVIKFKFYPQDAPNTVNRVVQLVNQGFYNGLTFHRVVPGFVVQGGDPLGNGTGGSGQKLKAEFNNRRHIEGTVAMARASDPDSADSQFYISLGTHPHLDHNYTVFGQVIDGMDVVRKIKVGDKMTNVHIE